MTPTELRKAYRIARSVATSFYRPRRSGSLEVEDLQQAGVIYLWRLRDRPRPEGVSWEAWAARTIRFGILNALREADYEHMAVKTRAHWQRATAAWDVLHQRLLREPTQGEVARALGMSLSEHLRLGQHQVHIALASEVSTDEGATFDPADTRNTPEQDYVQFETEEALRKAIAELPKVQRIVVEDVLYHGQTQSDSAAGRGGAESSTSQNLRRAAKKLNQRMKEYI
jgi:RNA polymerase sigma factor for flagellar operon FliA